MFFGDMVDPQRPYNDQIKMLKYLIEGQGEGFGQKSFSFPLNQLYDEFSCVDRPKGIPESDLIRAFLDHAAALSNNKPAPEDIQTAPCLEDWCAIHDGDTVILIGIVTGHPALRHRARTRTSLVFQVHPELGWARTWNRYYRLGAPSRLNFFEWQYEGKIGQEMQIVEFD
jgi:hypothetical protein